MSRNERLYFIALAATTWLVAVGAQPVPENRPTQSPSTQTVNQPARQPAPAIPPAIETDINRIARALEDANTKTNDPKEEQRAAADLQAQQNMAVWAGRMFFVGLAEAAVTFSGVVLVWFTLLATRRAAVAAECAVAEAKETTKAARDSINVTREIGEAQVRAYVEIVEVRVSFIKRPPAYPYDWVPVPKFTIIVENTGDSPAREFRWATTMIYGSELWDTLGKERGDPDLDTIIDNNMQIRERTNIPAGQRQELSYVMMDALISDHLAIDDHGILYELMWESRPPWLPGEVDQEAGTTLRIKAMIRTKFRDVFNREIVDTAHFIADFEKGVDRMSTQVIARRDHQPKNL